MGTPKYSAAEYLYFLWDLIRGKITVKPEITKGIAHGSNLDVDMTAEQLTSRSFSCRNGIVIKTPAGNGGTVYVGLVGVTAGTTPLTDGFPLGGGDSVTIEIEDVNLIYVIASQANQEAFWLAS